MQHGDRAFLSCLFGSEQDKGEDEEDGKFLSCLFGSEHIDLFGDFLFSVSELPIRQ